MTDAAEASLLTISRPGRYFRCPALIEVDVTGPPFRRLVLLLALLWTTLFVMLANYLCLAVCSPLGSRTGVTFVFLRAPTQRCPGSVSESPSSGIRFGRQRCTPRPSYSSTVLSALGSQTPRSARIVKLLSSVLRLCLLPCFLAGHAAFFSMSLSLPQCPSVGRFLLLWLLQR